MVEKIRSRTLVRGTRVTLSEGRSTADDAEAFARSSGKELATALEAALYRRFVYSIESSSAIVGHEGVPMEEGWYAVVRDSDSLVAITPESAYYTEPTSRLFVHRGAIAAASIKLPVLMRYGQIGGRTPEFSSIVGLSLSSPGTDSHKVALLDMDRPLPSREITLEDGDSVVIRDPDGSEREIDAAKGSTIEILRRGGR